MQFDSLSEGLPIQRAHLPGSRSISLTIKTGLSGTYMEQSNRAVCAGTTRPTLRFLKKMENPSLAPELHSPVFFSMRNLGRRFILRHRQETRRPLFFALPPKWSAMIMCSIQCAGSLTALKRFTSGMSQAAFTRQSLQMPEFRMESTRMWLYLTNSTDKKTETSGMSFAMARQRESSRFSLPLQPLALLENRLSAKSSMIMRAASWTAHSAIRPITRLFTDLMRKKTGPTRGSQPRTESRRLAGTRQTQHWETSCQSSASGKNSGRLMKFQQNKTAFVVSDSINGLARKQDISRWKSGSSAGLPLMRTISRAVLAGADGICSRVSQGWQVLRRRPYLCSWR
jgi:hypothetical protein